MYCVVNHLFLKKVRLGVIFFVFFAHANKLWIGGGELWIGGGELWIGGGKL